LLIYGSTYISVLINSTLERRCCSESRTKTRDFGKPRTTEDAIFQKSEAAIKQSSSWIQSRISQLSAHWISSAEDKPPQAAALGAQAPGSWLLLPRTGHTRPAIAGPDSRSGRHSLATFPGMATAGARGLSRPPQIRPRGHEPGVGATQGRAIW